MAGIDGRGVDTMAQLGGISTMLQERDQYEEPAMPNEIDQTHDAKIESWVESANDTSSDFPIQNLPYCAFFSENSGLMPTCGVRIGDFVLDFEPLVEAGLIQVGVGLDATYFCTLSAEERRELRRVVFDLLRADNGELRDRKALVRRALLPVGEVEFGVPVQIGDYTDFYASLYHATNVGSMFRPDNPILPNYKHIPIGYHGRASSIVASGMPVRRPRGQLLPGATIADGEPVFGPCKLLDYEMEVGFFIGGGNEPGEPIAIEDAEDCIVGMCLVNDWSARDMQKWEYVPLGPFLAKSFSTTVSPYIVTMDALAPFRCEATKRAEGDPEPLGYLDSEANRKAGGVDITLEVYLQSAQMRERGMDAVRLSRGSFKDMYWTISQFVAHHSSNGCNLQAGDLLASGTVSGPTRDTRGCLLELTWDGDPWAAEPVVVPGTQRTPIELPTGEQRRFLADGDELIMKGYCEREGYRRIGFGECRGVIEPATE